MVAAPTSLPARPRRERLTARIGAAAISLLACLIGLSAAVRLAVGWLRTTPSYFADEYLYAEMARSFLETGRPTIRGADAVFPSLLQPIITAPTLACERRLGLVPADPGHRRRRDVARRRAGVRARPEARPRASDGPSRCRTLARRAGPPLCVLGDGRALRLSALRRLRACRLGGDCRATPPERRRLRRPGRAHRLRPGAVRRAPVLLRGRRADRRPP